MNPTIHRNRYFKLLVPKASPPAVFFFFFNDTATTEIYTLSLHDALPISNEERPEILNDLDHFNALVRQTHTPQMSAFNLDRKSTRLNSSHLVISYAVFCLKKKNRTTPSPPTSGFGGRAASTLIVPPRSKP